MRNYQAKLLYIFLIIIYFIIGIYLIYQNSITSDEPAYIGAAYSYTQGLGLNQEHPLFLKLVNSAFIELFYPDYTISVPTINIISGQEQMEARLAAFNLGYTFLMERPENFPKIVFFMRFGYLFFNSLILVFFYIYTFLFKAIKPQTSICFAILYVFSPSFYGHNFLIAFDVIVSAYALLTILSLITIIKEIDTISNRKLIIYFIFLSFFCFIAINAKFSNLILIPIIFTALGVTFGYLLRIGKKKRAINFALLSILSLVGQLILTVLMYRWAFRNLPDQSILDNFNRYVQGIEMNLSTAGGVREPFWNGKFTSIISLEYLAKLFWFKENPGLYILGGFLIAIAIHKIITHRVFLLQFLKTEQGLWQLGLLMLAFSYPTIYFFLTFKSRFIIGYRYFYPLIIFIYFGLSLLTILIKRKWQQYLLISSLSLYIYWGLIGIPQSLSYVNPLWMQEKWQLTDDSTINWGQETQHGVQYLLTHRLLPEKNTNAIAYQTFGVNINVVQYLDLLSKQQNYPVDIQSYYANPAFNSLESEISQLPNQYLLIDSTVKQQVAANAQSNPIAAKNLNFFKTHKPIYSRNDILFIYKLY